MDKITLYGGNSSIFKTSIPFDNDTRDIVVSGSRYFIHFGLLFYTTNLSQNPMINDSVSRFKSYGTHHKDEV